MAALPLRTACPGRATRASSVQYAATLSGLRLVAASFPHARSVSRRLCVSCATFAVGRQPTKNPNAAVTVTKFGSDIIVTSEEKCLCIGITP